MVAYDECGQYFKELFKQKKYAKKLGHEGVIRESMDLMS